MNLKKSERKPAKAQWFAAIRVVRGVLRPKVGEPVFAERMAKWKTEEWALEKRRDDLLAGMCKNKPQATERLLVRMRRLKQNANARAKA